MTALLLGAFVTPALAIAGGAAASIPIVIHLLSKRRFRRVRWAAIDFLMEADRQNRRRVRMQELILLALRCLAMLLIGVMLARWFIRPEAVAAVLGSTARTERIVLIDDSYSMGARTEPRGGETAGRSGEATVFHRAKASLLRLVQVLRQESPGDALTIIVTSRPDRPLHTEASVGQLDLTALESELDELALSSRAGNLPAAFASVRNLLDSRTGALAASVYVISDFQQIDWTRGRDAGGGQNASEATASPAAVLADWAGQGRTLRVVLMDVGTPVTRNLAVVDIEPQQSQAIATVSGAYTVRIRNHGEAPSDPTVLHVYVGDAAQPETSVPSIPPGQTVEVAVEVTFPSEGSDALTVELEPDPLPADNTRSFVVPVARALRVLLVNGEPSSDTYQDEVFLMNVALRPTGPQFSGNEVMVVDENEFESTDFAPFHVVVLANVYRITEEIAVRLEEYVRGGGGLIIFMGDQIDPELYNRILYRDGQGVLPARLDELVTTAADRPVNFVDINVSNPMMRRFRDAQVPYFEGVSVYRYVVTEPATVTTAPAEMGGAPATAPAGTNGGPNGASPSNGGAEPRGPAVVLLRYNDLDRTPAIIERPLGAGHAMLITTTADKEWTNLPERPVYVVLMMEMVQAMARATQLAGEQVVGEPIALPIDPSRFQNAAILKLPSYPQEPAIRIDAQPDLQGGAPVIRWARTDLPGLYRFSLTDTTGAEVPRPFAVNVDPREGDLRRADRASLVAAMPGMDVEYVTGEVLSAGEQAAEARRELWPALLIVLVSVLMFEQALAWWFGADRNWSALRPPGMRGAA